MKKCMQLFTQLSFPYFTGLWKKSKRRKIPITWSATCADAKSPQISFIVTGNVFWFTYCHNQVIMFVYKTKTTIRSAIGNKTGLWCLAFSPKKFSKEWYLCNQRICMHHFINEEGNKNEDLRALFIICQILLIAILL
jgi:hypothetical protein